MENYSKVMNKIAAYSLMIAGLAAAIALCFHPDEFVPGSVLLAAWKPVHLTLLFAFSISIFGVVGIFNLIPEKPSIIGILAYFLGVIGCAGSAAVVVLEVFVLPTIASQAVVQVPLMEMMSPATAFSQLGMFFMSAVMIWIVAWILIGISILRSSIFNRNLGILIIIASVAIAIPTHFAGGFSGILHILVSILFGMSWIVLGKAILNVKSIKL